MNEIYKTHLTDLTKFTINEISKIENYFNQEINQIKSRSKKLTKYVAAFDYIDKILIVLSATSGGVSIFSSASFAGAPVGIAGTNFALFFSLTIGIIKKITDYNKKQKKKQYKILMLAKSKLNSFETVAS